METTTQGLVTKLLENKKRETIQLETLSELLNTEIADEEWLIDRVLPAEGFTFIVGAESTGKSFYTLTIANAVVTQTPWLNQFPVKRTTSVLFIDKENSRRRTQNRLKGLNITADTGEKIFRVLMPENFNLLEKGEPSPLAKSLSIKVKELSIGLIILDSFTDFMVGNENSSEDVQVFFDTMRSLFPGLAILVLHHENKPSQGITRTSSQRVRGSTNITAQIVSGFRSYSIPKTVNEFVLEQFKAGDAEKLKPFKVQLVSKAYPYDPTKTFVAEVKHNGEYFDEEGKLEMAQEYIQEYLEESATGSRKEIIDYCVSKGVSQRTIDTALKEMRESGVLVAQKIGKSLNFLLKE